MIFRAHFNLFQIENSEEKMNNFKESFKSKTTNFLENIGPSRAGYLFNHIIIFMVNEDLFLDPII